jgi:transcriptional regulator with GAF, ATPase, and Fis domain
MDAADIPGFRVREELGRDDLHVLLRAARGDESATVLLKRSRALPATAMAAAALRRERDVLGQLQGEGIPRVLASPPDLLLLEDNGGVPLSRLAAGQGLPVAQFLDLSRKLAGLVGRLHEGGFIHRGLRTAGVLATADGLHITLVDWSTVSRLTEDAEGAAQGAMAGGHGCLSPEQTGRMNRGVDHRTDFYALGAIFYELLTGRPPFDTSDPLELAHWHMARTPIAPAALDSRVPPALSQITMKLLAKMAEDRYQSTSGLLADLQRLGAAGGGGLAISLGADDGVEQFAPPQKLYGRDREVAELTEAFARAAGGETAFAFVGGPAGVGKTAIVAELGKAVAARQGRFVAGKFGQSERAQPYTALLQAMGGLCRQISSEGDETRRHDMITAIRAQLGANAGVLTAFVPELAALIGPAAAAPALGPAETQNRLAWAFQKLLEVFAGPDRPLLIFLDDLQWADMATLRLLATVLGRGAALPILWVGAFRDGEVAPDHPLARFRIELRDRTVAIRELTLQPLRLPHLLEFLRDAFGADDPTMASLAPLLQEKTDGNPFFVIQFLQSLERQGLLAFERQARRWRCDLGRVEAAGMTDNVVELMTRKLRHLPASTRDVVAMAAHLGGRFSLATLALVRQQPAREVVAELWEAIAEGLVRPMSASYEVLTASDSLESEAIEYRFAHDRIQQAAAELIAGPERAVLHLQVGRQLLTRFASVPGRLFEIVEHLNRARDLIDSPAERRRLAELDLAAGRRARASGAVQNALELFVIAQTLAPADEARDELGWTIALDAAECQLVCGQTDEGERSLDDVAARAPSPDLVAEALRIRIVHHEDAGKFADSVRLGLAALARLGAVVPDAAAERADRLQDELGRIDALMAGRSIAQLAALPRMQDLAAKRVATLIVAMWPSAFLANEESLTGLLSALLVRLSLEHGNSEESAIGYITHAITVNARTRDYRRGNEFGLLGLSVNDQFGDVRLRAKAHHLFGSFLAPFGQPLPAGGHHGHEAHLAALEIGDFTYAGRAIFMESWYSFFPGLPLAAVEAQVQGALGFLDRIGHRAIRQAAQILMQWSRALQGRTRAVTSLTDDGFDEAAFAAAFQKVPVFVGFLSVAQAGLCCLFGDDARAWEIATRAALAFGNSAEQIWHSVCDFYRGLAAAAVYGDDADAPGVLDAAIERLELRSRGCPANFEHHYLLLAAERARALKSVEQAAGLFRQAAAAADRAGFLNDRALVYERVARFAAEQGDDRAARAHLGQALSLYTQWGAVAKVRDLESKHPWLASAARPTLDASSSTSFDAASALKAAQAITAEIEIDRLLPRLVRIVIENAGAERGVLLEATSEQLTVLAEGTVGAGARVDAVLAPSLALVDYPGLPHALVNQVHQSGAVILIGDARIDPAWQDDPYVASRRPRSILCVPIVRQGVARGVLYLENTLSSDAFTEGRAGVVQVLASQAAISLENARLYQSMKDEVRRRAEAEAALTRAIADLEALKNRLQTENVYLQEEIRTQHNFDEIVGNSPALLETLRKVEKVAPTDSTVLVLGETGTGKELIARAIHNRSARRERPLVKVNCAAIAAGLVESELFGHAKGAFTGALHKRVGRFEVAHGGTVFLDEVGELPLETQAKLLRVLQEKEFEPVGSSKTQQVDVRVIAATNRNLDEAVKAGRFRADLLYRLNVFPIEIPPLRRRREDIAVLAGFFLGQFAKRLGVTLEGFRRADMERLLTWSWPGNVRELQNVVERAAILAQNRIPTVDATLPAAADVRPPLDVAAGVSGEARSIEEVERAHIVAVLKSTSWVVEGARGAAFILDLHPNTLRSRMKKLGITRARYENL